MGKIKGRGQKRSLSLEARMNEERRIEGGRMEEEKGGNEGN